MRLNFNNMECPPIKMTAKQTNIYQWGWQPKARFRDAVCGRRFGKTYLGAAEIRRAARLAVKWEVSTEDEIWYAAPTFKQAKRVFWKRLKKAVPRSWRSGKPNETECTITLKSGHVIRIVGLNEYDNLRGSGLFFLIVDEWADCPYAAWEEVLRPMLSTCKYIIDGIQYVGGHVLRIGTPKGFNHFYDTYRAGQPNGEPDHKSWQYTTEQGGNVPESELLAAKRSLDPKTYAQEYCASFETFKGLVYYCFDRIHNNTDAVPEAKEVLHIGMDFNVGKMAGVVYVIRNNIPYAVDEFMDVFDTPAMIKAIKEKYWDKQEDDTYRKTCEIRVYPDSSGKSRHTADASESDLSLLKDAGFFVKVNSTNPAVKDRINATNAKFCNTLGERTLFVNVKRCPKLTGCLEKQIYNDKSEPDKKQGFDHGNDGATYPIAYLYPIKKRELVSKPLRM